LTGSTENEPNASAPTPDAQRDDGAGVEPRSASTEATADAPDAVEPAADAAQDKPSPKGAWGGLTPSEAARKRWADKRARDADADEAAAHDARRDIALIRVTVETGAVIDKLAREAKGGNVQAARELREWLSRVEAETDLSVSALDRGTRQRMKVRLLAEVQAEASVLEGVQPDPSSPGAMSDEHDPPD
jgi:hypothetical protein